MSLSVSNLYFTCIGSLSFFYSLIESDLPLVVLNRFERYVLGSYIFNSVSIKILGKKIFVLSPLIFLRLIII